MTNKITAEIQRCETCHLSLGADGCLICDTDIEIADDAEVYFCDPDTTSDVYKQEERFIEYKKFNKRKKEKERLEKSKGKDDGYEQGKTGDK